MKREMRREGSETRKKMDEEEEEEEEDEEEDEEEERMKKGADPAAIYTRSGADRGKTPQFCSVRFCKLIFRRATIFCRARGGTGEKERRGEERREVLGYARGLSLSLSFSRDGPRDFSTAREPYEMATLATIAFVPRFFCQPSPYLFSLPLHDPRCHG